MASCAKVILRNAEGKIWPVELEEIDGRGFLTTGWPKFIEGNCLGEGEFLVFEYEGNMHFRVSVFGVNAVEKTVWPSGSGAQATWNLKELPCGIFPSRTRGQCDDNLTEEAKSLMHRNTQVDILDQSDARMRTIYSLRKQLVQFILVI